MLDRLVAETQLREKEPRLEKYMCAVLMTELLFGAGHLNGESKPVQCIRRYEPEFRALLAGGGGGKTATANGGSAEAAATGDQAQEAGGATNLGFKKGTNAYLFFFVSCFFSGSLDRVQSIA